MKAYTYLFVDLGCLLVPFLFSFYKKHAFYKDWKYFFPANIIVAILFLIWDYWFTKIGVWGFNSDYLLDIYLFNLPIEEVLFFICIPYACTFTYFCFKRFFPNKINSLLQRVIIIILITICIICLLSLYHRLYTLFTAILLLIALLYIQLKKIDIIIVLLAYCAVIPFFFLSNGILTGSFIEEPIVWYNTAESSNIRMYTIPLEDIFYGFLLVLSNVLLYEKFKSLYNSKMIS